MVDQQTFQEEESELFEHFRLNVDPGQNPLRIDKFLMLKIENASRNKIQNAAKAGNILVNDKPVKSNYKVRPADKISIVLSFPPREIEVLPEDIPVNIVYEDDDILVLVKPPGVVVHPAAGHRSGTLAHGLLFHCDSLPGIDEKRPGIVHRLDKDTSGIMLVAKTDKMLRLLSAAFKERRIHKTYHAPVSYTHLTLPTTWSRCSSGWWP